MIILILQKKHEVGDETIYSITIMILFYFILFICWFVNMNIASYISSKKLFDLQNSPF